jgi:hypothetical protein
MYEQEQLLSETNLSELVISSLNVNCYMYEHKIMYDFHQIIRWFLPRRKIQARHIGGVFFSLRLFSFESFVLDVSLCLLIPPLPRYVKSLAWC